MIQAGLDRPDYLGILRKILLPLVSYGTPHESRRHDGYYENGSRGPGDDEFSLFTFTVRCRNCHFQGSANQRLQTGRRQGTGPACARHTNHTPGRLPKFLVYPWVPFGISIMSTL